MPVSLSLVHVYEIVFELSGFKKISRSNVQLDAAGAVALDFTLETGALTEEVTVTAEATADDLLPLGIPHLI